jgi:hypothetical protein
MSDILQDKVFKVVINDDQWHVYLITDGNDTILDEHDLAECDFKKREMYFRDTSKQIVTHELIHALMYYTFTETAGLTALQVEETMCELVSHNWHKIEHLSSIITKQLNELRGDL